MTDENLAARLLSQCRDSLALAGLKGDSKILVALSGGLDSTVLLDLLVRASELGGPTPDIIHVDHGLRRESAQEARFCVELAHSQGLAIDVARLHIEDGARGQKTYRDRRLAAIARHAIGRGIEVIALGHHGDDRLETFFLNLMRGAGLRGLTSMSDLAPFPLPGSDLKILRPLLASRRAELEDYARFRDLSWVEDPSNATDKYTRNRVRHHVIPALEEVGGSFGPLFSTLSNLEAESQAARFHAEDLFARAKLRSWGIHRRSFRRSLLARAPQATVAHLFLQLHPSLDSESLLRIYRAICAPPSSSPLHLTLSGCLITVVRDRVVYEPAHKRGARDVLERQAEPLCLCPFEEGSAPFFGCRINWSIVDDETDARLSTDPWTAHFNAESLTLPLQITGVPRGGRIQRRRSDGEIYHQKLSKILSELRVDADLRWRWPCLLDAEGEVLWAAGLTRGSAAFVDSATATTWEIRIEADDELTEILHF